MTRVKRADSSSTSASGAPTLTHRVRVAGGCGGQETHLMAETNIAKVKTVCIASKRYALLGEANSEHGFHPANVFLVPVCTAPHS
eukprot:6269974-Amphidinium_carterae.1